MKGPAFAGDREPHSAWLIVLDSLAPALDYVNDSGNPDDSVRVYLEVHGTPDDYARGTFASTREAMAWVDGGAGGMTEADLRALEAAAEAANDALLDDGAGS